MQNHNPPTVWTVPEPFRTIYTHATEMPAGTRQLHVSGQFGIAPDGAMRPDFAGQLEAAMDNVEALLASAGMSRPDMARRRSSSRARRTCLRSARSGGGVGRRSGPQQ